jgi:hypothetical protein
MKRTKSQEQVRIAKDVIAQITARKLKISTGSYFSAGSAWYNDMNRRVSLGEDPQLKDVLPKKCEVCAIGAVFVAAVDRHNKLKLNAVTTDIKDIEMLSFLKKWFTERQMRLMEAAFEGRVQGSGWNLLSNEEEERAEAYRYKYPSARSRLVAIMKNVIRNKGAFRV